MLIVDSYQQDKLGWSQEDIADAVVSAGYEKEYKRQSVQLRLQEFVKLQKLVFSQFDSAKPIKDIVKENEMKQLRKHLEAFK